MKVSNSQIQCYKSCRRMYELRYVEGVVPNVRSEALERGSNYHDKVEQLLKTGEFDVDFTKASAMATAFKKYIYPRLHPVAEEEWFGYETAYGDNMIGRIDARNADGAIIEHKTTSLNIDELYWYSVQTDEQLMTYMSAYHVTKAYYTVCKTPTIKQRKTETDEDFFQRCIKWYEEDTSIKIAMREVYHTNDELKDFLSEQALTIKEMSECKLFYRNRGHCNKWGRMCEYAPICQHYDPNETYIGFERKE